MHRLADASMFWKKSPGLVNMPAVNYFFMADLIFRKYGLM